MTLFWEPAEMVSLKIEWRDGAVAQACERLGREEMQARSYNMQIIGGAAHEQIVAGYSESDECEREQRRNHGPRRASK